MVNGIQNIDFVFTDGWHPTVNPSSRMPIYYLRHKQLFPSHSLILNEFPRTRGGSTFRFIRFQKSSSLQNVFVKAQTTLLELMPWWLPSTLSEKYLFQIYDDILKGGLGITESERYCIESFYAELKEKVSDELSIGELVNSINFDRYRIILPDLPEINCITFSKSIFKDIFEEVLSKNQEIFFYILAQLCKRQEMAYLNKIAFCNDEEYNIYRISWVQSEKHFYKSRIDMKTGKKIGVKEKYPYENFMSDIQYGCIVLSSKITCILELLASLNGKLIFHFGNTYNHLAEVEKIISDSDFQKKFKLQMPYVSHFDDYKDTWNYGYLRFSEDYPIHLFDLLPLNDKTTFSKIRSIVDKSIADNASVSIVATNNLSESIRAYEI